jgi:cytochrome b
MEDDMYDNAKFKAIKQDIAYALLYRPNNPKDKVVVNFLWKLLCCAVYNGMIEEQDVEYAIEASNPRMDETYRESLSWRVVVSANDGVARFARGYQYADQLWRIVILTQDS